MPIDYDRARQRIIEAFGGGLLRQYGPARVETEEREIEEPGGHYWDKECVWTDPKGVQRRGRFQRMPSKRVRKNVDVPKGVDLAAVGPFADAMADALIEVIRILEEAP